MYIFPYGGLSIGGKPYSFYVLYCCVPKFLSKKKKSCMHYKVRTKFGVDDAENKVTSELHDTHTLEIAPAQHKREDLAESIGVVPAKYPPKVKLELLTTLEC